MAGDAAHRACPLPRQHPKAVLVLNARFMTSPADGCSWNPPMPETVGRQAEDRLKIG